MPTVPTTIALPMLLNGFDQAEVIPSFKIIEHYWDCCVVGNALQTLLRKFFYMTFMAGTELIKFGLVLFMAYLFGRGIFDLWDSLKTDESPDATKQFITDGAESRGSYPYVVELPAKISEDSMKQRKSKDKTRRSSTLKDDTSTEPRSSQSSDPKRSSKTSESARANIKSDSSLAMATDSPRSSVEAGGAK